MEYRVDLELRGHSSWHTDRVLEKKPVDPDSIYHFSFGRYRGLDIRTIGQWEVQAMENRLQEIANQIILDGVDRQIPWESREALKKHYLKDVIWQLDRAMKMENTLRRRACARRRLIELGELVRRDWKERYVLPAKPEHCDVNGEPDFEAPVEYGYINRKWMPRALANYFATVGDKKGLFFENGKRIDLEVKQVRFKSQPSEYGMFYTYNLVTPDGQLVTYRGGKRLDVSEDKFTKVKATIKHDRNETFIQRIKM